MKHSTRIFYTEIEDGTFVAVSIDSPRFCVGAKTAEEALAKAHRALAYYNSAHRNLQTSPRRETRVVSPSFRQELLYA
jgi:hypothetical protein